MNTTIMTQKPHVVKRRKDNPPVIRGQQTRDCVGLTYERSILLTRDKAATFCKCLRARDDISVAEVRRDHSIPAYHGRNTPRFFVRWIRVHSTPETLTARTMQDARAQRAAEQQAEMEFFPHPDRPGWFWTIHTYPDSDRRGVYETHPSEGCTCPDHAYRCASMRIKDKHQLALAATLAPAVVPDRRDESPEARRARIQRQALLDF